MNLKGVDTAGTWHIFSMDYLVSIIECKGKFGLTFEAVAVKRVWVILLCLLISTSALKKYLYPSMIFLYGFGVGIIGAAIAMQYGKTYFSLFFTGCFLHSVLYLCCFCGIFTVCEFCRRGKNIRNIVIFLTMYIIGLLGESLSYCYIVPLVCKII